MNTRTTSSASINDIRVAAYRVPTATSPESDGTATWYATTAVIVVIRAAGYEGIGYTYAGPGAASVIIEELSHALVGEDALQTASCWAQMQAKVRNLGRDGITSMAISACDVALWDLKGKILDAPVCVLLGAARERVPVYGSGGFTSYTTAQLTEQLENWVRSGIPRVKMKIGRKPNEDVARVEAVRSAIGPHAQLFVDANGAYARKQALELATHFAESDVSWFEEPVYHQDFEGLTQLRERAPAVMEIASGEYGYGLYHFARLLDEQCVDVLQADATRCGGFSGLLAVDGLCQTKLMPLSTHCAPNLHLHAAAACKMLRHMEYFYDHVRIEHMLFDGAVQPAGGAMTPDLSRPGIGLEVKWRDAERYAI